MDKATKLMATALTLWLCAASCADSAGLSEEQTRPNRTKHVVAKTTNARLPPALQARARADAMLGFRYEHGLGVPQSFEIAADLYLRAAEQGDPAGQHFLGLMYDKGHGVWQDGILAYKWLNLAAARAPARYREQYLRMRDAAASKLTLDQIYMGQELATQWVPKPQP
jgi:uncharacterized protein